MFLLPGSEPQRIVIIDWSMIGDLIMLSPSVAAIRANFPQAHVALLGQPTSIAAYANHPAINELIPYDRSQGDLNIASFRHTLQILRDGKFDRAYIFHNSIGSALMAWLGGVRQRIGYRHELRDLLLTTRLHKPELRQHLIEDKADLLRLAGLEVANLVEEVYIDQQEAERWIHKTLGPNFGRNRPIVALSIGATRVFKQWHAAGVNALLNCFPINSCDLLFLGAPNERSMFEGVYSYNNTVVDLIGQTTLKELAWVLDKVDLYIGPDSGPMHIAIGRQTPVVALFGPTDPARCGPFRYPKSRVIRSERICPQCDKQFGKVVRQCVHLIESEQVYAAADELLSEHCKRWSGRS
jgi:lipopolysaccharide heptosyltransferase II